MVLALGAHALLFVALAWGIAWKHDATPASFEPSIDYVVTKIPRWAFEKFPGTSGILGTQMQSVGEAMAIGRTFTESLQKALRSLENGRMGLNCDPAESNYRSMSDEEVLAATGVPTPERLFIVGEAIFRGISLERIYEACKIDHWFLDQMLMIVEERRSLSSATMSELTVRQWRRAKRLGFSDAQLGHIWSVDENDVRCMGRNARGVRGMMLEEGQSVIAMLAAPTDVAPEDQASQPTSVLTATENGFGKRTPIEEYTRHGRGTKGMIAIQQSGRNGKVVAATLVHTDDEIMLITDTGVLVRTRVSEIREMGRATQGVTLIGLDEGSKLIGMQRIADRDAENVDAVDAADEAEGPATPPSDAPSE